MLHTTVRLGLDKAGAATITRLIDEARHNLSHGQHIVSVYYLPRHPVRGGPAGDVLQKTALPPLRRERELVVLAHEDHRKPPHRSQVHRLMGGSLIRPAIAEKDHGYAIPCPRSSLESAAPVPKAVVAPTMPLQPSTPKERSAMCMEPPKPLQ